jgi:hypothetical protein
MPSRPIALTIAIVTLAAGSVAGLGVAQGASSSLVPATTSGVVQAVAPKAAPTVSPRWLSSSSGGTSCAVLNSGAVVCWGAAGNIVSEAASVSNAVAVSVGADIGSGGYTGYDVACALLSDMRVTCWGDNSSANAGAATLSGVTDLHVGGAGACFVVGSGTTQCFLNVGYATPVPSASDAVRVSVGTYAICVVRQGGQVDCEGSNWLGHVSGPESISDAVDVSLGDHHACVLRQSGAVTCWGISTSGYPTSGMAQISVGATGGCAVATSGPVTCWPAQGAYGVAVPASAASPVVVAAGWTHICALKSDGGVVCWSDNPSMSVVTGASAVSNVRTTPGAPGPGPTPTPTPTPSPTASPTVSPSASPSPSPSTSDGPNGWSLLGSLILPTRTGTTLRYSGDITAPQGGSPGDGRSLGVRIRSTGVVHFLTPATSFAQGTSYYDGSLLAEPLRGAGELDLVIAQYRSTPGTTRILASGLADTFSLPAVMSRTDVTQASSASVVVGESVVLSSVTRVLWSDGVTTDDTPSGSFRLQFRATGTALWETISSGRSSVSVSPTAPGDYRFLVGDKTTTSTYVNVVRPTSAFRINDWSVNSEAAFSGTTLEFSGTVDNQFDDAAWRPAAVGTAFELQFLADGSGSWQRVVRDTIKAPGQVSIRWPMAGTGRFRLAVGGAISASLPVNLIVPTSVVALDVLDLPSEVDPGDPVDISVGVEIQYSDGEFRPAPDGTTYEVEFAASDEPIQRALPGDRAGLLWETIARGKTRAGLASASVRPDSSGYWRVSVGRAVTSPVFVAVPGGASANAPGSVSKIGVSKPKKGRVTVTWGSPATGKGPFEYQIRTSANGVTWGSWTDLGVRTQATVAVSGKQAKSYVRIRAINARGTGRELQITL